MANAKEADFLEFIITEIIKIYNSSIIFANQEISENISTLGAGQTYTKTYEVRTKNDINPFLQRFPREPLFSFDRFFFQFLSVI